MKNYLFRILTVSVIASLLFSGCTAVTATKLNSSRNTSEVSSSTAKDIKFYTIYNDFVITANDGKNHQSTINTFTDNDTWFKFEGKNFTGVKLPPLSLYSRKLICIRCYPAKITLLSQRYIDHITLIGGTLSVYLEETGVDCSYDLEETGKYGYNLILATVAYTEIPQKIKVQMEDIS